MNKITKYFRGVGEEAKRVRWPGAKTLFKAVLVVLVISILCALFMVLFDFLASRIMKAFEAAFPKKETPSEGEESTEEAVEMVKTAINYVKLRFGGR